MGTYQSETFDTPIPPRHELIIAKRCSQHPGSLLNPCDLCLQAAPNAYYSSHTQSFSWPQMQVANGLCPLAVQFDCGLHMFLVIIEEISVLSETQI